MTIARNLGRRVAFHGFIAKEVAKHWAAIRRESDVLIATGTILWTVPLLYTMIWNVDDLRMMALGEQ